MLIRIMIGGHIFGDRTTLIRGAYVLTLDPTLGDMPDADVLIDTISAVGRTTVGRTPTSSTAAAAS
jgi:hypothetical protein